MLVLDQLFVGEDRASLFELPELFLELGLAKLRLLLPFLGFARGLIFFLWLFFRLFRLFCLGLQRGWHISHRGLRIIFLTGVLSLSLFICISIREGVVLESFGPLELVEDEVDLFFGLVEFGVESVFAHSSGEVDFLGEVFPLEARQILQQPQVVASFIAAFLPAYLEDSCIPIGLPLNMATAFLAIRLSANSIQPSMYRRLRLPPCFARVLRNSSSNAG
jgi:hypothetical protein